jgi:hypothetical protein
MTANDLSRFNFVNFDDNKLLNMRSFIRTLKAYIKIALAMPSLLNSIFKAYVASIV